MKFLNKILNGQKKSEVELTITSSNGFHLRPIVKFVNEVKRFKSKVKISINGREISAQIHLKFYLYL